MQRAEKRLGIDFTAMQITLFADEGDAATFRKVFLGGFRSADDANVEMIDPVPVRRRRRLVPVVDRLVVDEPRRLAWGVDDEAMRVVDDQHPRFEVRGELERVVAGV